VKITSLQQILKLQHQNKMQKVIQVIIRLHRIVHTYMTDILQDVGLCYSYQLDTE